MSAAGGGGGDTYTPQVLLWAATPAPTPGSARNQSHSPVCLSGAQAPQHTPPFLEDGTLTARPILQTLRGSWLLLDGRGHLPVSGWTTFLPSCTPLPTRPYVGERRSAAHDPSGVQSIPPRPFLQGPGGNAHLCTRAPASPNKTCPPGAAS